MKLTIEDAIGPFGNYRQAAQNLKPYGLMYMDQITMPGNDKRLQSFSTIKKAFKHNPKGRKPLWYKLLENKIVFKPEAPFDTSSTQNNHTRKWSTSAENITELVAVNDYNEYFRGTGNRHLEIDPDD